MSLLGRLEDLSFADIVQIVFLSRRTGALEIIDSSGRFTVLFRHGLIVNVSSPNSPDLITHLRKLGTIDAETATRIRAMEDSGVAAGTALIQEGVITAEELGEIVQTRVVEIVQPLLESREGEFNFILSESIDQLDMEYDADQIFKDGGLAPQKVAVEGEKLKPLRGLEESLKAGKALIRGTPASEPRAGPPVTAGWVALEESAEEGIDGAGLPESVGLPELPETEAVGSQEGEDELPSWATELPFDEVTLNAGRWEDGGSAPPELPALSAPFPLEQYEAEPAAEVGIEGETQFEIVTTLPAVRQDSRVERTIVLFERDPVLRVAARRAFTRLGIETFQFSSFDAMKRQVESLLSARKPFITFLELEMDGQEVVAESLSLMESIKRRDSRLPVVVIDSAADLRRRHRLLRAGADMYLTRPSPAHLKPALADEQLALFADELVLFAERAFAGFTHRGDETGLRGPGGDEPSERKDRSFFLLKQLINELSSPDDISQVTGTTLHVAAEFLERGALFTLSPTEFVGVGGFGPAGEGESVDARVKKIRIPRDAPSILRDVVTTAATHRGKLRREPQNVALLERLGVLMPSAVVVFPILHQERPIAVLYTDNAGGQEEIGDTAGLEIFLSQAGFALGNALVAAEG